MVRRTSAVPPATLGRSLYALLGDVSNFSPSELEIMQSLFPPSEYDPFLRSFFLRSSSLSLDSLMLSTNSLWVRRALSEDTWHTSAAKRYKPVDRKVRPVPTYMPNPSAQVFKPIPEHKLPPLPFTPPPLSSFHPTSRLTLERLNAILSTIPEGFLGPSEIDLLVYVLNHRQRALAFTDAERGHFSREYFPDYEMPVIEHTP